MTLEELEKEAMRLAPEARAHLASQLISSLDDLSNSEVERLWLEEAVRRDAELDSGSAGSSRRGTGLWFGRLSSVEDVIARARARRA